jgi:hypothetical protein
MPLREASIVHYIAFRQRLCRGRLAQRWTTNVLTRLDSTHLSLPAFNRILGERILGERGV